MKTTIEFKLGDLSNGEFASYATLEDAQQYFKEAVSDGYISNFDAIGEEGCPWETEEHALQAAKEFFYIKKSHDRVRRR